MKVDRLKLKEDAPFESPWVLVEGPGPAEARFLDHWLLSADEADQAFRHRFEQNPSLYFVRFSAMATKCIELFLQNQACFLLDLSGEWSEEFAVMADLGFFRLTGDRYQMTVPIKISSTRIEAALLRLAATEDEESLLRPERLVRCLDQVEAENGKRRLERLPSMQRVADRAVLLEEF